MNQMQAPKNLNKIRSMMIFSFIVHLKTTNIEQSKLKTQIMLFSFGNKQLHKK